MLSLVVLSQTQLAVLGISLFLVIFLLFQRSRVRMAAAERQHDGWHAFPESDRVISYRASGCEDSFIADLSNHFPGKFSDEDRLQIRLFLQSLPADFAVFLQLDPVRIYQESGRSASISSDHLPPQQDFWIRSPLSYGPEMECYQSVFVIPPEHYPGYDREDRMGHRIDHGSKRIAEIYEKAYGCQRLVFAHPVEDGLDEAILAFVPTYVVR